MCQNAEAHHLLPITNPLQSSHPLQSLAPCHVVPYEGVPPRMSVRSSTFKLCVLCAGEYTDRRGVAHMATERVRTSIPDECQLVY